MSIQWNKEVKMKDVKKFLNQEISLGEIDYHKCLQVSLMVVAFGIIPAFTYGTVLGTLEGQRVALMGEVSSLKAEVLSAKSSLASVSYFKARLSAASPVERIITTSDSSITKDVVLGVIEITSSSTKRVLDRVTVLFADNASAETYQYYRNIRLIGANKTYTPDKMAKGYAVFTDVAVASTGEWSQFVLKTDIAPQNQFKNGTVASTTFVVEQTKIVASNVKFLQSGVVVYPIGAVRLNASSPIKRIVQTSIYGITKNVVLGIFDLKASTTTSRINSLQFSIKTSVNVPANISPLNHIFQNVRLINRSDSYLADSVGSEIKFSSLSVTAGHNNWEQVMIVADIADQDDFYEGLIASTSIETNVGRVTASDIKFQAANPVVTNASASYSLTDNGSNPSVAANIKMRFTFNNIGNDDLYVSKNPSYLLATSSTIKNVFSSGLSLIQATPSTVAGDTAKTYVIPSGTSRTFELYGAVINKNGIQGLQEFKVTKIYHSTDIYNSQKYSIDLGLENLRVTPTI